MANNTESSHRRAASAASSIDGAVSNDGTLSGPASTVPTARSTPFIGPQNHPGIPPQHHPATVSSTLDNADVLDELTAQLEDPAFASQLDEVQTQIRMLGLHSHHTIQTPSSRYRANLREPIRADGVDPNELYSMEADLMFAQYYYHFDPADGPFPPSNTIEAITASMQPSGNDNIQWGPRQFCHVPDIESDNEENNEAIMATYDTPLIPRYQNGTSYSDFLAASFARPARPGTIAGMAIRDRALPAQTPPIIRAEPHYSADAITETTQNAHAGAAPAEPTSTGNGFDTNLAAVVRTIETRPASTSTAAMSQRVGADPSSVDTDVPLESPVFPVNWVTHTRSSMLPSLQPPTTSSGRPLRRRSINYTISPFLNQYTEEGEGDGA